LTPLGILVLTTFAAVEHKRSLTGGLERAGTLPFVKRVANKWAGRPSGCDRRL